MASGDFLYTDQLFIDVCLPWSATGECATTVDGLYYIYDNGLGGTYSEFSGYCSSGYIFFGQAQFGSGAFINSTGCYCCTAHSNGLGSYYWDDIYYSGTILSCSQIILDIDSRNIDNGCCYLISDGYGNCFYDAQYCNLGFSFFQIDNFLDYVSNGTGSYLVKELSIRNAYDVCINWDFSKRTKSKYNFTSINACGTDVLLSLNNSCIYFYEINSICDTSICILEATQCKTLHIEDSCIPFIYIKNIGNNNLNLKLSNNSSQINFKQCQIYKKINYIDNDVILKSKESIMLSVNASTSGDSYYSNIYYPFGFFYEFKNVDVVNSFGLYPVCCAFDCASNTYFPTYLYSDICNLPIQSGFIIDTGYGFCYQKQLSFNENLKVDCYSTLEISFQKITGTGVNDIYCIDTNFQVNSYFGCNTFGAVFQTNEISISDENGTVLITDENPYYSKDIENNSCINIVYDVDVDFNKFYNLIYLDNCLSGSCYDLNIKKINTLNECTVFNRNDLVNSGNILLLKNNENAYVEICTDEFSAIKDLRNKKIDRNNIFLPLNSEFSYQYCFELNKSNYLKNRPVSGFWNTCCDQLNNNSGFCNYSTIISCCDTGYQVNKSNIYNIILCNQDNRKSTTSIQDKSCFVLSDDFYIPRTILECSFYFCDLEFKYNPVECILYRDNYYLINSDTIEIEFSVSGNCEIINFPKNAINYNKLKINTDFEIFDTLECSDLNINYLDFSFVKNYTDINCINYTIPIIQCCTLSGYEYPQISLANKIKQVKQTNIKIDINPINNFIDDSFYGLNNFLLFITSKLNSGLALDFINCGTKLMCDYCYDSSEYNFLMMDLKSESDYCNLTKPLVTWTNIDQRISFDENKIDLISYKNCTGNGYNYVLPVIDCIQYSDQFSGQYSLICSEIVQSGLLNYINTGLNYDGSSRTLIYLFDTGQNITGCYCSIDSGSTFLINNNNYYINLQSSDMTGLMTCRNINVSRNYKFTGIQPFFINSNYAMLDIKYPMVCNNLQLYCLNISEDPISGLFYYIYDINNPVNNALKLNSPEFTSITDICWSDKNISQFYFDSKIGQIQKNSAKINLDVNNLVYENPYILNCCCIQTICINMIGGL